MRKSLIFGLISLATGLLSLTLFAAFEAHVINVTARIENALTVDTSPIEYGTVFPQEQLDRLISVALSQSFQDEQRVDDVNYVIRQKPKCWSESEQKYGRVTEADGRFICADGGDYQALPLLCPYLSKHEITNDGAADNDSAGINAFHGNPFFWTPTTTLATQLTGRLAKSEQDTTDSWKIDLRVPCFKGSCAQDWEDFVKENNPDANPADFIQLTENEHKLFGCDLWVEVGEISQANSGPIRRTISLWGNFNPSTDLTPGEFINVSGYTEAILNFDWQGGALTHTCQYAYHFSSDGVTDDLYSTFLYFPSNGCQNSASIPLVGINFLKIDAWTPPSGAINATLTLIGPATPTIALWDDFYPTTDQNDSAFIDVSGFTTARLDFYWYAGTLTHTCQYSYQYSSDGVNIDFDSTFQYFPSAGCQDYAVIPLNGTNFLRVSSWTPPSGILFAGLTLTK